MIIRFAKSRDIKSLAKLHLECGEHQPGGFMFKLGLPFLRIYYKLLINEKNSIILVSEDDNGNLIGFISGTMAAEAHLENLKRNRFRIGLSILPAIIKSPKLLTNILDREKFVYLKDGSIQFGVVMGPRIEYWAFHQGEKRNMSIPLLKTWLKVVFDLGIVSVRAEVDINSKNLLTVHKFLGAKVIEHLMLNDGRERVIIEYKKR
jgi:hypothetical protein